MQKILILLAIAICIAACHSSGPGQASGGQYVFDVARILAMDARKIPDSLGQPFSATLPTPDDLSGKGDLAEANFKYKKDNYELEMYYYYKSGIITTLTCSKKFSKSEADKADWDKEKADLPLKFNLKNIYISNYKTDTVIVFGEANGDMKFYAEVNLANMPGADTTATH